MSECDSRFHVGEPLPATAYQRGCRGDVCRAANAERIAAWRTANPPAVRRVRRARRKRAEETVKVPPRLSVPPRHGELPLEAIGLTEWARGRGYDPVTRTYAEAAS